MSCANIMAVVFIALVVAVILFYAICSLSGFDWMIKHTFCKIGLHEHWDWHPPARFMANCVYCGR